MGCNYTKVEYECMCGAAFGHGEPCEETNAFYLKFNRTVDVGTLYHKYHNEIKELGCFDEEALSALTRLMMGGTEEPCNKEEIDSLDLK